MSYTTNTSQMHADQIASEWPEGVIARYLTVGGATADVIDVVTDSVGFEKHVLSARCTGEACPWEVGELGMRVYYVGPDDDPHQYRADRYNMQAQAQRHAEKCRAMSRPGGAR